MLCCCLGHSKDAFGKVTSRKNVSGYYTCFIGNKQILKGMYVTMPPVAMPPVAKKGDMIIG